jgi:tetratricopeptide (TPR) repeat protein
MHTLKGQIHYAQGVHGWISVEYSQEHMEKAEAAFSNALQLNAEDTVALRGRGTARARLAERKKAHVQDERPLLRGALEDLDACVRLDPGFYRGFIYRADVHLLHGIYAPSWGEDAEPYFRKALEDTAEALRRRPGMLDAYRCNANIHKHLAAALDAAGKDGTESLETAVAYCDLLLEKDEDGWKVLSEKGDLLYRLGRKREAEACFRKAVAEAPAEERKGMVQFIAKLRALTDAGWFSNFLVAHGAKRSGDFQAARYYYRMGIASANRLGAPDVASKRGALASAHANLAAVLAQAAVGNEGRKHPRVRVPPRDKADLLRKSVSHVRRALDLGWKNLDFFRKGDHFDPLRDVPEFEETLAENEKRGR